MSQGHERFPGYRVAATFVVAVLAQAVIALVQIRAGFWDFILSAALFLIYLVVFGAAFLAAMRRASLLPIRALRFAAPIFCSALLVISSFILGGSLASYLNDKFFHMSVEDFDR